jgi:hypothetical protein
MSRVVLHHSPPVSVLTQEVLAMFAQQTSTVTPRLERDI